MDEVNPSILESPAIVPHPKQTTVFPNFFERPNFSPKNQKERKKKSNKKAQMKTQFHEGAIDDYNEL